MWHKGVNIGSGNDLVTTGNKPLPKPMLTHILPYGITRPQLVNAQETPLLMHWSYIFLALSHQSVYAVLSQNVFGHFY